uniref:CHK kinase-like domain-containing protein n=1 Tax=Glossina morsitans morsitans TaxID=37546 RepID=A0A1B0GED7_GLOMM
MSVYNFDELQAPDWQYENTKDIELVHYSIGPASFRGDHYASIMFRCKVVYKLIVNQLTKRKSMILKTVPPEDCAKRELLMASNLFETEISMYTKALPKIKEILGVYGDSSKLYADLIYFALKPHKIIIIEDLCDSGYEVIRGRLLTEDEIKMVYAKIAKFHAISYMLAKHEGDENAAIITAYQDGIFSSSWATSHPMIANGIQHFKTMLAHYKEFYVYLDKVKVMEPTMFAECKNLYRAFKIKQHETNDIFVLNHGDFHPKNLMFKFNKESNQLEDVIMVDYQASCFAPSTVDMIYSQYMMLGGELLMKRHVFMQYYFEEFVKNLQTINYRGDMPKYSDLQISSLKYRHFTLFMLSTFLPIFEAAMHKSLEYMKNLEVSDIMEAPEKLVDNYYETNFVEILRKLLPQLLREGYLD